MTDNGTYREGDRVRTNRAFPAEGGVGRIQYVYGSRYGRAAVYAVVLDDHRVVAAFGSELDPE